jgi:hypothetical protein
MLKFIFYKKIICCFALQCNGNINFVVIEVGWGLFIHACVLVEPDVLFCLSCLIRSGL